jgi:hypothetical protein
VFAWYFLFFIELDLRLIGAEELGNPSAFFVDIFGTYSGHIRDMGTRCPHDLVAERDKVNPCPLSCLI